jgi:hypothetical protein
MERQIALAKKIRMLDKKEKLGIKEQSRRGSSSCRGSRRLSKLKLNNEQSGAQNFEIQESSRSSNASKNLMK